MDHNQKQINRELHTVCELGLPIAASFLIKAGGDVNSLLGGESCLHRAAERGNEDVISLLLANGATIQKDDQGYTPLEVAVMCNKVDAVILLVKCEQCQG